MLTPLRHRGYRLFWAAELVSRMGFWLQLVAQTWLIWHLTGSALFVGLLAAAQLVPALLLAPAGGLLADRWLRRDLLLLTQIGLVLPPLGLWATGLAGRVNVGTLVLAALVTGVLGAVDTPTRMAMTASLVPRSEIASAMALDSLSVTAARMVGPAAGAALVAAVGANACFLVNAASYLAVISVLVVLRSTPQPAPVPARQPWRSSVCAGLEFAAHDRPARNALLLLAAYAVCTMNTTTLLPLFADHALHLGSAGFGFLLASLGAGATAGALSGTLVRFFKPVSARLTLPALIGSGSLALLAMTASLPLALGALCVMGFAQQRLVVGVQSLLQLRTPEELRGRVMAVFSQVLLGGIPLGAILAGALAAAIGALMTWIAGAFATASVAVMVG